MRSRVAAHIIPWRNGTCLSRSHAPGAVITRNYTAPPQPPSPSPGEDHGTLVALKERSLTALQKVAGSGRQWGHKSMTTASATATHWWERYEEFVGLNEIKDAQSSVTEAEKAFMVARGMVREAHLSLEAMQGRLKEVRDRLDRVSREEAHYLELATQEHRLLQEERRLRTAYENAEGAEREKFSLFSAGVRESHEKERTRAERTKNWSVIGSVLGALIGVMGSTYVNRVRLQELKNLLLEAQKGPVSLQEAIKVQAGMHRDQQEELRGLIDSLRVVLKDGAQRDTKPLPAPFPVPAPVLIPQVTPPPPSTSDAVLKEILDLGQRAQVLMEGFQPRLGLIEQNIGKVELDLLVVKELVETRPVAQEPVVISPQDSQMFVCDTEAVMRGLDQTEKRLEVQIGKTSLYNTVLAYAAFALTVPALYVLFKGTGT